MLSFTAYFHGLERPHMICDIWPQWREFGERARSGGRLGRKTERNTIKYVQLSGKISICQLFVFFLVFLDSQEIVCVRTRVCVCVHGERPPVVRGQVCAHVCVCMCVRVHACVCTCVCVWGGSSVSMCGRAICTQGPGAQGALLAADVT